MSNSSWQHPFVNIFKHFDINSSKKCVKQGDVTTIIDHELKSIVYRIRGVGPANNYIQFPSQSSNQNLCLTGRLLYILFRPVFNKHFCIHIDILTHEQHLIRISLSNSYREFKVTQTLIQFPYITTGTDIHWSVLCLDLQTILLTYTTNQHYHMIKSFQLCGNMFVKNCFSSQFLYEPGIDNDTAKRTGLTRAGIRALPHELSYPIGKSESWHDKYDFIMFPNISSLMDKNPCEPFDKVGNVCLPTPRKLNFNNNKHLNLIEYDTSLPFTVQTTLVNGQISNSITDLAHLTRRSMSPGDFSRQFHWHTYNNLVDHFPTLPTIKDSANSSLNNHDGIHLFINNPQLISSSRSMTHDSNSNLNLTSNHYQQFQCTSLLPDPILRLRTVIGFNNVYTSLLWTQDNNYILYPSNAIVVQMHIETQQQWFFIGHTDKISAMAFNNHTSVLATIQTGADAILRLWKFETRHCICTIRVFNTSNLHALDFGTGNSTSSLVVVGHDEQSHTIVCIYNALNISNNSIQLVCRATTNVSITHVRFVPYDTTKFISIGPNNIHLWHMKNENDLKSINISTNEIDYLEYTDLQFQHMSNNKLNKMIVYIATKSGYVLEFFYDERRIIEIHRLSDKLITKKELTLPISTLMCTDNFYITGSHDGYVRVWSIDFSRVYIEAKYEQAISAVISSYDQTRVLIATVSGSLSMLNLVTKTIANLMRSHAERVNDIDYDDTRKQLISVGQDGTIRLWCFCTGKQLLEFTSEREIPLVITYTPNRNSFACGFNDGTIKIFDLNRSTILNEIKHHNVSITGLLYSFNGLCLLSSDQEGALCLSDASRNYKLQKATTRALISHNKGPIPLSISPDGKHTVYVGPTEFIITIIETNTLNQILQINLRNCQTITNEQQIITSLSSESALFARFTSNRYLLVATITFKLFQFDSYTGKLLNIIDDVYKYSFDSLALSSDNHYLITGGDVTLKFCDANMKLDINFQNFHGHSEQIRKVFFTDDNMHIVSIGDSILIWNVLAWKTLQPSMANNVQCLVSPQSMMSKILEPTSSESNCDSSETLNYSLQSNANFVRTLMPSLSNSNIVTFSQEEKKIVQKKLLNKQTDDGYSSPSSSIRRHFIQRIKNSQLAKKRYAAPINQESLKLQTIIGYNGNGRENLVWYPQTGFFAYTIGCNIIVENLNSNQQSILTGHTEEISTMTLSNDGTILVSAQCSLPLRKEDLQVKIIIWNTKTLEEKFYFHECVQAIQSMAFSIDDRFLATIGNYRKPMVTIWSTSNYHRLLNWQDKFSSFYINCLVWNPMLANEFCLGCSHSLIHFCTINERTYNIDQRLQVNKGEVSSLLNEHGKTSCDITACRYITSSLNLVVCATNSGFLTCWNSRLRLCVLHWKADSNEICYLSIAKHKLLTGSSTGCLKLWNIENLEMNLGQLSTMDLNYSLTVEDEFQLDDGIISGSFDNKFDMGIVGTLSGSLWYICWTIDRSKIRLVTSHTDQITGAILIEDSHIVTSSLDGTIRIFKLEDRNEILRFSCDRFKVTCLTSWDNSTVSMADLSHSTSPLKNMKSTIRSVVAGYNNGTIGIFNLLHGQMVLKLQAHKSSVTAIHIPLHTIICLSGASDGSVAISNLVQGLVLRVVSEHYGSVPIRIIDSRKLLENNFFIWLIVSDDQRVSLWKSNQQFDLCSFLEWLSFSEFDTENRCLTYPSSLARFIDTDLIMFTGFSDDKSIQIYNIDKKRIVRTMPLNQWCSCFDLSNIKNKNCLIAIGTRDRLIQLKDYNQETFQDFIGHNDIISIIEFNRSNNLLITISSNEIFVWKTVLIN